MTESCCCSDLCFLFTIYFVFVEKHSCDPLKMNSFICIASILSVVCKHFIPLVTLVLKKQKHNLYFVLFHVAGPLPVSFGSHGELQVFTIGEKLAVLLCYVFATLLSVYISDGTGLFLTISVCKNATNVDSLLLQVTKQPQ